MLARDPAERYGSYDEVIQGLAKAQLTEEPQPVLAPARERCSTLFLFGVLVALIVSAGIIWFAWKGRGIERPTAPAPSPADAMPATAKGIEFNPSAPWVKPWNAAMLQLTQGRYADALRGYESALQLAGPSHPGQSQWIQFFEGMTLLAADRASEADSVLTRAHWVSAKSGVPEELTSGNLANVLIETMLGVVPLADMEAAIPRMSPWAVAVMRFTAGFKHLDLGEFEKAAASFRECGQQDRPAAPPWKFNLQPLADRLAGQCDQAAATMSGIDSLGKARKYEDALAKLNTALANANLTGLKRALRAKQPELERAAAQAREKTE